MVVTRDTPSQTTPWNIDRRARTESSAQTVCWDAEEAIAKAWLRKNGLYVGKNLVLRTAFWHHFMSCLKRPAGRADRASSQQCAFCMDIPSQPGPVAAFTGDVHFAQEEAVLYLSMMVLYQRGGRWNDLTVYVVSNASDD